MRLISRVGLVVISVTSLVFSSCTVVTTRQQEHANNVLEQLEVEKRRGEQFIKLVEKGTISDPKVLSKYIEQRNRVLTNSQKSIRIILAIPEGYSTGSEEGSD